MPTQLIRPNDSRDYYGAEYQFEDIYTEYANYKGGENVVAEKVPEHIKINTEKDITGTEGAVLGNEVNGEVVKGETHNSTANQIDEGIERPNLETANDRENDEGRWFDYDGDGKITTSDITAPVYDAGQKVYSIAGSGIKTIGEGANAMISGASKSVAVGMNEGLGVNEKYEDFKKESKEQIQEIKEEVKNEVDNKYKELVKKADETTEQMKTALYVGAGVIALWLIVRK